MAGSRGRDLNPGTPEYEAETLTTRPRHKASILHTKSQSSICTTEWDGKTIMNDEQVRVWKEAVVVHLNATSRHSVRP
jgi:hypothetical protein